MKKRVIGIVYLVRQFSYFYAFSAMVLGNIAAGRGYALFALPGMVINSIAQSFAVNFCQHEKERPSVVVLLLLTETVKLIATYVILLCSRERSSTKREPFLTKAALIAPLNHPLKTWLAISVPSILYTIQGQLILLAHVHLDVVTLQVLLQSKAISSAIFARLLLRRKFSWAQSCALVVMSSSIALHYAGRGQMSLNIFGCCCVLAASLLSGLSGTLVEALFKNNSASIWVRNVQLSVLGIAMSLVMLIFEIRHGQTNLFQHFGPSVWLSILLSAQSGLLVAYVVKVASNIAKCFCVAISIILSSVLSHGLLKREGFDINTVVVIIGISFSTIVYAMGGTKTKSS